MDQNQSDTNPISLNEWESALSDGEGSPAAAGAGPSAPSQTQDMSNLFDSLEAGVAGPGGGMDLVMDIPIHVSVELGRTKIPVKSIVQLGQGSVIELDGRAGEPLDVFANGTLIARAEVVVVNDRFGVRLTELVRQGRPKKG